jgi:CheY-like chemotaxis protein
MGYYIDMRPKGDIKILICDDMEAVVDIYLYELENLGILPAQSEIVSDGNQCIDLINSKKYDLIIADLDTVNFKGMDFLEKKKESKFNQKTLSLVITARKKKEDIENAIALGAHRYIIKPFKNEFFIKYVKDLLKI